jgi:hypothetical protein
MSGPISTGYLRPAPSRIRSDQPEIRAGDRATTDLSVPDWHYLTDLTVEWILDVDFEGLTKDCGLTDGALIGAVLAWRSERTNLRGSGRIVNVVTGTNNLTAILPGGDLGGAVTVEARIVLLESDNAAERLAPARSGSLLWNQAHRIILEGSGGRFPTAAVDFVTAGLPGGVSGMWYLEIADSDLGASATQALRLYLNSSNTAVRAVLDHPAADTSLPILRFLRYETSRQLMQVAFSNEEFDDRADYVRGTLGDVLVTLLRIYLPGRGVAQLRNDYAFHPAEVDAELLAAAWKDPS